MRISKIVFLLISVVFFFSACSTPPERIIKYKTSNNCKIEFEENKFGEAKLVSNEYSKKEGCFLAVFDKDIKEIWDKALSYMNRLKSIVIPNSVKSIGEGVFELCFNLTSVEFPNNLTSIGEGIFIGCSRLKWITIDGEKYFIE